MRILLLALLAVSSAAPALTLDEILAKHAIVTSLEVVEVNPVLDERNATASLAVELVCSALGARIL